MTFRVTSWRQITVYSATIIFAAMALALGVMAFFLPPLPLFIKVPIYTVTAILPFFIAAPVTVAGLYMFKTLNAVVDALDAHVKYDTLTGLLTRGFFLSSVEAARKSGGYVI